MNDLKLVRALAALSKEEWMSFRKHLLSYTSSDSEIYSLFTILKSKKSNFESMRSPAEFRAKNFPNINQKAFLGMLSKIYKFLEDWMAVYEFRNTDYQQQLYLIKALLRKGLINEAKTHAEKLKKKLGNEASLDLSFQKLLCEVDHLIYFHNNKDLPEERHKLLKSASYHHALAYKETSQFYISELINRSNIFQYDYSEMIDILKSSSSVIPDTELSNIGFSLIEVLKNKDLKHADILMEAAVENRFKKDSELEKDIISYLSTFIMRYYNSGKKTYNKLISRFINFQFQAQMRISDDKLPQVRFHNRVDSIANFISHENAKEFIDTWIDKVETPNRKETKDLAYSQLYFIKRDFDKMMEYSRFIAFDNYGQRTRAWLHNVICLYVFRKENYDLTIQSLVSFKKYLKRNRKKYSKFFYLANMNTIIVMEKLIKNDFVTQKIDLEDYGALFYKKWITEECEKAKRK